MKKIIKVNFSKIIFLAVISFNLISCKTQTELITQELFKMDNVLEGDTRGVFIIKHYSVMGGVEARINSKNLTDSIPGRGRILFDEDYRDVHCFDTLNCLYMNSGKKGKIVSMDLSSGLNTRLDTANVFLNSFDFWDDSVGIVMGDPIEDEFFISRTTNGGKSWARPENLSMPKILKNEIGYAASGTTLNCVDDSLVIFGTGGAEKARLFKSVDYGKTWTTINTPIKSGESYGIFSVNFWNEKEGMIIGGSYIDSTYNENICFYTKNGGKSWSNRSEGLLGYCSSIVSSNKGKLVLATGRMGTYYSLDKGKNWTILTKDAYFAIDISDKYIVMTGRLGKIVGFEYTLKE